MADNVATALKSLNDELQKADRNTKSMHESLVSAFNDIEKKGLSSKEIIDGLAKSIGGKAEKFEILFGFQKDGKPFSEKEAQNDVEKIKKAIQKELDSPLKLKIGEFSDKNQLEQILKRYNEYIRMITMSWGEFYDMVNKPLNTATGTKTKGTAYSNALASRIKEEAKAREKIITLQNRQLDIQNAIDRASSNKSGKTKFEGQMRSVADLNKELERTSRLINQQNAVLQGSARGQNIAKALGLKNAKKEADDLNESLRKTIHTAQRLGTAFGVAFSVQGLVQFGKKLVETRGEFEMQFVAMKQIIGDVDQATKIWNQTMQQALQSPFKAMQLTDYTKKLAAYRIETDKLFDTTKRLADVSAGLGVDMQRLILAYGQVKAANYLRASEVRQFTEAGVNIYGELAKYFSEIEGRAIGTAEMVERVSKRMVLFSDVEKIFQRMTDEGGAFFNMQEIQADTVRGQIMKLHDAYDQMLNTIGQGNDGPIRNLIEALNSLVRNWREVSFTLKANINWVTLLGGGVFMLASKWLPKATTQTLWFSKAILGNSKVLLKDTADIKIFSKVLGDYTLKQRMAIVATRSLQGALYGIGNALRAIWPLLVFEGIVQGIRLITKSYRELKQIREELGEVASTNVESMNDEINGYEKLIKKLEKTNEGSIERKEILNEISSKYGKYLDFVVDETTKVEDLAGAYDKVVSSIRTYTAEKIREEQQQRIEKAMYDEYQDMVSGLTGKKLQTPGTSNEFKITKVQAKRIAKIIQETLKEGGVVDIQQILNDYFGGYVGTVGAGGGFMDVGNVIRDYISQYKELADELRDIRDDIEDETPVFKTQAEYDDYNNRRELADRELQEQKKRNEELITQIKQNNTEQWKAEELLKEQRIANIKAQMAILEKYGLKQSSLYSELSNSIKNNLDDYETDYNKRLEALLQSESKFGIFWKQNEKDLVSIYNAVVSTNDRLQQGTEQWNKQIRESYKGIQESLKQYEAALKAGGDEKTLNKNIAWAKLMMRAYEIAAKLRGIDLTEPKHTGGQQKESVSKMLSLLREMNSEYEKLSKTAYGYAKAEDRVRESFERSFKAIFKVKGGAGQYIDMENTKFDTKQDLANALQALYDGIKKKGGFAKFAKGTEEELLKAIDSARVEADIDVQVRIREDFARQMEEAFNNYDLTLELQNLGISEDMAKDLFPDLDYTSIGKLQEIMKDFYESRQTKDENGNVLFSEQDFETYKKWADKVDAEILKARKDRAKRYSKYLEKEYSERAKLEIQYAKDVAFVTSTISDETQRDNILTNLNKKYQDNLNELNWKSFKESDFYIDMMDDITSLPKEYTQMMLDKIEEILQNPETLSPRALKEAINARQKVLEAQMNLDPLSVMQTSLSDMRQAKNEVGGSNFYDTKKKLNERVNALQEEINALEDEANCWDEIAAKMKAYEDASDAVTAAKGRLTTATTELVNEQGAESTITQYQSEYTQNEQRIEELQQKQREGTITNTEKDQLAGLLSRNRALKEQIEYIQQLIQAELALKAIRDSQQGSEAELNRELGFTSTDMSNNANNSRNQASNKKKQQQPLKEWLKSFDNFGEALKKLNANINSTLNSVAGMGNACYEMFDALGASTDAVSEGWKEFGNTMISTITQTLTMIPMMVVAFTTAGTAINAALGIIGLIAEALQLLFTAITAISRLGDSYVDREIENHQKKIDELIESYEELEDAIKRAMSSAEYVSNYDDAIDNLNEQIAEAKAQIKAAEDYKDDEKREETIDKANEAIEDAQDKLKELKKDMQDTFLGFNTDDFRSMTEDFVSAWLDAYEETGDGFDAMMDNFEETMKKWFIKQAVMRLAGAKMETLLNQMVAAIDEDGNGGVAANREEIEAIRERAALLFAGQNDDLKELYSIWGLGGDDTLSGLAAGIQGMTEEQANVLEAYWNSVRQMTASIDSNVASIALILGAGGVNTNPMLTHLQTIADNTSYIQSIYELLAPLQTNGGNGRGFRTYQM